jgi:hypothetical protein
LPDARDLEPELRPLPDAETQALAALCQRRNQLLEMEQMEKSLCLPKIQTLT